MRIKVCTKLTMIEQEKWPSKQCAHKYRVTHNLTQMAQCHKTPTLCGKMYQQTKDCVWVNERSILWKVEFSDNQTSLKTQANISRYHFVFQGWIKQIARLH